MVGLVEQSVQHEHVGGLHMLLAVGHVRRVGEVGVAVGLRVEGEAEAVREVVGLALLPSSHGKAENSARASGQRPAATATELVGRS